MWLRRKIIFLQTLLCFSLVPINCKKLTEYEFVVKEAPYRRLCSKKPILTVNGQFPGPTITAYHGETIYVNTHNKGNSNITLHWHGVQQPRNPWSDGPEYITQCPIKPGGKFRQKLIFSIEEGTLWWHAHSDWDRATVHGPIFIYPKKGESYPFPTPDAEVAIVLGEWWKSQVKDVHEEFIKTGGTPNTSDAITINGQPGDFFPCSKSETFKLNVDHGKTYFLRIVNAAMNLNLFFSVSKHNLTVVGTDSSYTKPLIRDYIVITPGQTVDALLHANQKASDYYMAARAYSSALIPFNNATTTARIHYMENQAPTKSPPLPYLPDYNDTKAAFDYYVSLKGLTETYPYQMPKRGTKVAVIKYGSTVELVFQGTNLVTGIGHPIHVHGFSLFAVGFGFGNFDKEKDPMTYNLVDPALVNTVLVPNNGWASVRFHALNPGVWFVHCHLERHLSWGMETVLLVTNGEGDAALLPPPPDMPPC
ncbi:hypothetical protein LR48_Vigan10g184700 [Vigna angularis]|uniref:laccase n=2 Tax=Phaseolus angularis TaxID=3914 RepID=A0A0L9VLQ5_PHAAN|nr:hypothetical protein LR48_Vigan10g184700 [Vigna angularis]